MPRFASSRCPMIEYSWPSISNSVRFPSRPLPLFPAAPVLAARTRLAANPQRDHKTAERWRQILENLYVCFRTPPYGSPRDGRHRKPPPRRSRGILGPCGTAPDMTRVMQFDDTDHP